MPKRNWKPDEKLAKLLTEKCRTCRHDRRDHMSDAGCVQFEVDTGYCTCFKFVKIDPWEDLVREVRKT